MEAIGLSAAQVQPGGQAASRLATPAHANVRPQCLAMADLRAHRSDWLLARMGVDGHASVLSR